jgi:hypothetical protein
VATADPVREPPGDLYRRPRLFLFSSFFCGRSGLGSRAGNSKGQATKGTARATLYRSYVDFLTARLNENESQKRPFTVLPPETGSRVRSHGVCGPMPGDDEFGAIQRLSELIEEVGPEEGGRKINLVDLFLFDGPLGKVVAHTRGRCGHPVMAFTIFLLPAGAGNKLHGLDGWFLAAGRAIPTDVDKRERVRAGVGLGDEGRSRCRQNGGVP